MSTHAPLQAIWPVRQLATQAPDSQRWPAAQALVQLPQCVESV